MSPNVPPSDSGDQPTDPRRGSGPAKPTPPPGASSGPRAPRTPPGGVPESEAPTAWASTPDPYGQPSGGQQFPPADPEIAELAALEEKNKRRFAWLAAVTGVGLAIAIAALVVAIGASNQGTSDDKIAEAVKRESANAARQIEQQIQDETKQANEVLDQLRASTKAAKEASTKAAKEAKASESGVAENAKQITALQKSVDELSSKVDGLPSGVSGLEDLATSVADLNGQVDQLVRDVKTLQEAPSGSGDGTP